MALQGEEDRAEEAHRLGADAECAKASEVEHCTVRAGDWRARKSGTKTAYKREK